jgi:hypothetical protein
VLRYRLISPLLVAIAPAVAHAETLTQTVPFDYDANFGVTFPVVQGFDTLGGGRELVGVTFDFHHNFELDLFMESTGPTAVSDGDFLLDLFYVTLYQLGEAGKGNPPVLGPGALFVGGVSGDLAAYDGIPGNDGPDSFRRSYTDAFTLTQTYTLAEPDVLAALTAIGPITTVLGGFTELFFAWVNDPNWPIPPGGVPQYPDDAALWVSTPVFRHFGDIVITYEYNNVPEPATIAPLAALALLARRRTGA